MRWTIAPGSRAMFVAKLLFIAIWVAIPPAKYGRVKVGWSDKTTGELLDKNSQQHFVSYYELVIVLNFYVAIFVGSYCSNTNEIFWLSDISQTTVFLNYFYEISWFWNSTVICLFEDFSIF